MRIDILTIFPAYLDALSLSLVGKARADGLLDVAVHDLRSWTQDRHRTVDDTPFGGGAGMVMRPDVWGRALDDVLADGTPGDALRSAVLVVPTPAGEPLTQAMAHELASADHLVLACGRYEGIDARVVEHYAARPDVTVREVSIGDYVLNGGEVAALVVVEAVARLLPGVIGNPASLVEESHGAAGLLEYPVYTKPPSWAGHDVPDVLTSGHHGRVARWRRDQALRRTAERRPDLVAALEPASLDAADRKALAAQGWFVAGDAGAGTAVVRTTGAPALRRVHVRPATAADADALADLAARTFHLACPPTLGAEAIEAFVTEQLGADRFAASLADPERLVHVAEEELAPGLTRLVGYTLVVLGAAPPAGAPLEHPAELSKCYVLPEHQGSGVAGRLLAAATAAAREHGARTLWLGTNRANRRAQRFYARHGFVRAGSRRFTVGGEEQDDVVMTGDVAPT